MASMVDRVLAAVWAGKRPVPDYHATDPNALYQLSPDRLADWVSRVLADADLRDELGEASRDLAEQEFALEGCATRFERLLAAQVGAPVGDRRSLAKL